jgi:hypothetical protein
MQWHAASPGVPDPKVPHTEQPTLARVSKHGCCRQTQLTFNIRLHFYDLSAYRKYYNTYHIYVTASPQDAAHEESLLPANPYHLYSIRRRNEMKLNGSWDDAYNQKGNRQKEFSAMISKGWKELSDEDKRPFKFST